MTDPGAAMASGEGSPPTEGEELRLLRKKAIRKAAVLLGVVLVLLILTSLPPVRGLVGKNEARLREVIESCGAWGPAAFVLGVAVLVGAGVPRLVFCFLGGALFGFWGGLAASSAGTMMGYSVVFFAVRRLGLREVLLRHHPTWGKLAAMLRRNSIPAVILFRQVPLPGIAINTVLALSPIRGREFLLGSLVGMIPEGVPLTLFGAGLAGMTRERLETVVICLVGAVVLLAAGWIGWSLWTRRRSRKEPPPESPPPGATPPPHAGDEPPQRRPEDLPHPGRKIVQEERSPR